MADGTYAFISSSPIKPYQIAIKMHTHFNDNKSGNNDRRISQKKVLEDGKQMQKKKKKRCKLSQEKEVIIYICTDRCKEKASTKLEVT